MTAQWTPECANCTAVDINLSVNGVQNFDYTGKIVQATVKKAGKYKLEVWGAQGGEGGSSIYGGYGAYSYGTISLSNNSTFYVTVGEAGKSISTGSASSTFNGGGDGKVSSNSKLGGSGGGATDIAIFYDLSINSYNNNSHWYSRIIVAGGGGASHKWSDNESQAGGNGGGYTGGLGKAIKGDNKNNWQGSGGTQTSGGAHNTSTDRYSDAGSFGLGGGSNTACTSASSGGGGGWYGGGGGCEGSAGGGSGYIYNSSSESSYPSGKLVNSSYYLSDAGMYMYSDNCTSSTATGTKTTCTSNTGAHTANYANTGNGYAKITYLGT